MRANFVQVASGCLTLSCAVMAVLLLHAPDAAGAAQPTRGTSAAAVEASPDVYKLAKGEFEVKSAEFDLPDAARGKSLPLKAYTPMSGGPYPLIIFSHGAGGNRNVAPGLTRHWASHGYVVIAPSHADSVQLRKEGRAGKQMDDVLKSFGTDPTLRSNRVADIQLIIDSLAELPELAPLLAGKIDPTRIGLGGHSAGAMTASLVGGATINPAGGAGVTPVAEGMPGLPSFRDERVDAVLLLSGQGMTGPGGGFHRHSWDGMDLPVMVQTGSFDNSPRTRQTSASRRHPYDYAPPGDKYLVFIEGALHMSFTGRAARQEPGLAARWIEKYLGTPDIDTALQYDQPAIFAYIITSSQAFWDAYLKDDTEAKAWLQSDKLAQLSQGQVEYLKK
jgi:predicted dienelactone hydrolase